MTMQYRLKRLSKKEEKIAAYLTVTNHTLTNSLWLPSSTANNMHHKIVCLVGKNMSDNCVSETSLPNGIAAAKLRLVIHLPAKTLSMGPSGENIAHIILNWMRMTRLDGHYWKLCVIHKVLWIFRCEHCHSQLVGQSIALSLYAMHVQREHHKT